ncbi:MAG: GTP-binding protein [Planctomycetota bacterium]|nr:MAG: GTP-binding protein [Planctomycetota bacterium]
MTSPAETRVVLLTGTGRAAVATLRVEGPQAVRVVDGLFHSASGQPLEKQPEGRVLYGRWRDADEGEEVVVCRREDGAVEIHCHGGAAASAAIRDALVERGCRAVDWRQWVRDSVSDPLRAEAQLALASAPTERAALILLDQLQGALGRAVDTVIASLSAGDAASADARLERLLGWAALGCHLTEPWKVVLAGRPNAGKSSLINALVGYERAIVHDMPGTTRDVVTAAAAVAGWPIELADTAGLRESEAALEAEGIERAQREAQSADLVLLVVDRSRPLEPEDEALASAFPAALRVWNKCDLPAASGRCDEGIEVSALTGDRVDELIAAIAGRLVPTAPDEGEAIPFTPDQVEVLTAAREKLACRDVPAAMALLATLRPASK